MSVLLSFNISDKVTDRSFYCEKCYSVTINVLVSVIVVLVGIGVLCRYILQRQHSNWGVTEDKRPDNGQQLHGISEQKKIRILSEVEVKARAFKLRQQLLAENRALKSQICQQKELLNKLSDGKRKCDESIEQLDGKITKMDGHTYALIRELSQLDHNLELEHKRLNETKTNLNETQMTLEETKEELLETQRALEEMAVSLQQEQQSRMDLSENFRQLQNKLREEQNEKRVMVAALQREVGQCKEELQQAKISHDATIREKQREKRILHDQLATCKEDKGKLEERLREEKEKYKKDMKAMQDQLNKFIDENKGYKVALEHIKREKTEVMAEHKKLLRRLEAAVKELEKFKEQTESRNTQQFTNGQQ